MTITGRLFLGACFLMNFIQHSSYRAVIACGALSVMPACQHGATTAHSSRTSSAQQVAPPAQGQKDFLQKIPGTTLSISMIAVVPMNSTLPHDANHENHKQSRAFWIQAKEVTWDLYDTFVYQLDEVGMPDQADGMTRPSKPYVTFDRGWGHAGYPALSMSAKNAESFCAWLSAKTGRQYQLPTQEQWTQACQLGHVDSNNIESHAWFKLNSKGQTHPVGTKLKSQLGTYDMWGNVAEWVTTPQGPILVGGSYRNPKNQIGCHAMQSPVPGWNESDPQIPKSQWWLADAPFAGLRVVCTD